MNIQFDFDAANMQDEFLREVDAQYVSATPKPALNSSMKEVPEQLVIVTYLVHSNPEHRYNQTGERTALNHWGRR